MIFGIPFAWLALREAYRASEHRATSLTVRNIEAYVRFVWDIIR
jgi:hypothetical protein